MGKELSSSGKCSSEIQEYPNIISICVTAVLSLIARRQVWTRSGSVRKSCSYPHLRARYPDIVARLKAGGAQRIHINKILSHFVSLPHCVFLARKVRTLSSNSPKENEGVKLDGSKISPIKVRRKYPSVSICSDSCAAAQDTRLSSTFVSVPVVRVDATSRETVEGLFSLLRSCTRGARGLDNKSITCLSRDLITKYSGTTVPRV